LAGKRGRAVSRPSKEDWKSPKGLCRFRIDLLFFCSLSLCLFLAPAKQKPLECVHRINCHGRVRTGEEPSQHEKNPEQMYVARGKIERQVDALVCVGVGVGVGVKTSGRNIVFFFAYLADAPSVRGCRGLF
jgi:hypothetical protein